jgi:hypothetical protein
MSDEGFSRKLTASLNADTEGYLCHIDAAVVTMILFSTMVCFQ